MNEAMMLGFSGIAGLLLGAIFFFGLWWTVQMSLVSTRPAPLIVCSFALRTAIALSGFYFVGHDHVERLLACVVGFVVARFIATWLMGPRIEHLRTHVASASDAP